jgi:DNA-binding NarL/FixJ family response regulator
VDDIEVVDAVEDGSLAVQAVLDHRPQVVLMDLSMPEMDGTTATRHVLDAAPDTRVVVLTSFSDAEQVTRALSAGAVGYLLKDAEPDVLVRAIRDAAAGGAPLSPRAATALLPGRTPGPSAAAAAALSDREREVLGLVAQGLPNKLVARRLGIAEKTVKAHLTRIFAVLGVSDRTTAALWAQRHDIGA